ncbi:MAG: hypothetical protein ACI4PF_05060 [Christensenellales bacterium]
MKEIYKTNDYAIFIVEPNGKDFHFPYILCVPNRLQDGDTLFVESNNEENPNKLYQSAELTTKNILSLMNGSANKSPILVPILPTNGIDSRPYFQQLSHECFDENLPKEKQRIDLQLVSAIEDAKNKIFELTSKKLDDKIFMHGYSASGVFAQRFALAQPEIIGGLCIGGAIGSIPMPMSEYNGVQLDYPAGTNNYEQIFGKPFNAEAYKQIKFRYYVAEREAERLSQSRVKEDGTPAPMHDMSYMDRSMPSEVGHSLRTAFGVDMNERCRNQLFQYKQLGFDVSANHPYKDIKHNEIRNLAFKYIDDCLSECTKDKIRG